MGGGTTLVASCAAEPVTSVVASGAEALAYAAAIGAPAASMLGAAEALALRQRALKASITMPTEKSRAPRSTLCRGIRRAPGGARVDTREDLDGRRLRPSTARSV